MSKKDRGKKEREAEARRVLAGAYDWRMENAYPDEAAQIVAMLEELSAAKRKAGLPNETLLFMTHHADILTAAILTVEEAGLRVFEARGKAISEGLTDRLIVAVYRQYCKDKVETKEGQ